MDEIPRRNTSHSDDEVILASSCPKKRAGRKKFKETRHPIFRGVRQRNGNRWVCEVRAPNKNSRIWLGTYPTAEMAARAHDVAALALRGKMACLNFADSAWRVRVPESTNTQDIQKAAAEAAEAFRGEELGMKDYEMEVCEGGNEVVLSNEGVGSSNSNNNSFSNSNSNNNDNVGGYVDEEAVFDMPRLLVNMAEGLLLPPPQNSYGGVSWNENGNANENGEGDCEVSLWSFSI